MTPTLSRAAFAGAAARTAANENASANALAPNLDTNPSLPQKRRKWSRPQSHARVKVRQRLVASSAGGAPCLSHFEDQERTRAGHGLRAGLARDQQRGVVAGTSR